MKDILTKIISYLMLAGLIFLVFYFLRKKVSRFIAKRKLHCIKAGLFYHVGGLQLAPDAFCNVLYCKDNIIVIGGGMQYHLDLDKVTDISTRKKVGFQKDYYNDTSGAIIGAMFLGTTGAILGGGVKEKRTKVVSKYLTITYNDNGKMGYMAFDVSSDKFSAWIMGLLFNIRPRKHGGVVEL